MLFARLKKLRVVVSIVFFLLTAFVFVDFKNYLPVGFNKSVLFLQFVPSLLKFLNIFSLSAIGFIFVILITLLFGRVYCSSICPVGTLQDIIGYFTKKIKKKKRRFHYLKPLNLLRFGLLTLVVISALSGSLFLLNIFEPYSNFGRINMIFLRPFLVGANNSLVWIFEHFKIYSLFPFELRGWNILSALLPVTFSITLLWLVIAKGRLFCNTLCPVGAFLGLISRFSFYKIDIAKDRCKGCGACERVCKAGCIDNKEKTVDFSRCVSCLNCFSACPTDGLYYKSILKSRNTNSTKTTQNTKSTKTTDFKKREFIVSSGLFLMGFTGLTFVQNKIKTYKKSTVPLLKNNPVTPPGALNQKHFTNACTACQLCVSQCPTQVLQPSYLHYGFLGFMQPHMDYDTSFCNFDCNICGTICPNGAILPVELEKKKTTQLGRAKFVKENCIVYAEGTDCGACSEHCPTKAVSMVPYNKLFSPKVNEEICIGCGACEYACPARPYKAIYVEGNPKHLTAKKPEVKKNQEKVNYKEDFPF